MNTINNIETFFDSPERSSDEEVLGEILKFKSNPIVEQILEGFPDLAVILNKHRQIVAFNTKALTTFKTDDFYKIVGKRLGEAIHCIHKDEIAAGCGTSEFCRECGAGKAIKKTNDHGTISEEECRITTKINGKNSSLDLSAHTLPIQIDSSVYTMFAIRDISNVKRREMLERIFFHDVLNTAGALNGLAEILPEVADESERNELISVVQQSTRQLLNEIIGQRELRNAEDGNLQPKFQVLTVNDILMNVYDIYKNHRLAKGIDFQIHKVEHDINFISDSTLLVRSFGNLVKNAFEASDEGETVKIFAESDAENITFSVHSCKLIPREVQLQLFQRSFSTKQSRGRGIGLYSVKLIVEQYLKGKANFISSEESRTIFSISLPKNPPAN